MWNSGTGGKADCKVQEEGSTEGEGLVRGQVTQGPRGPC